MMTGNRLLAVAAAVGVSVMAAGCGVDDVKDAVSQAKTFNGCKAFATQGQAQAAWQLAGKPAGADGDKDGKVCESLPASSSSSSASTSTSGQAKTTDCVKTDEVQNITFDKTKYPLIRKHTDDAIAKGWPSVLVLNRAGAEERRAKLLANVPTKDGYDRDEYPPAVGRGVGPGLEKGSDPTGWQADVRLVPSSENRSHGSTMGLKLRRFCDGTKFRYVFY